MQTGLYHCTVQRDGSLDLRTLHAACPALLGVKWVANKWIREGSQVSPALQSYITTSLFSDLVAALQCGRAWQPPRPALTCTAQDLALQNKGCSKEYLKFKFDAFGG